MGPCKDSADGQRQGLDCGSAPFFSIIITTWNRETTIARCLESILTQDCDDYEIIVVDDGSRDRTVEVIKRLAGKKVRLHVFPENRGIGPARQAGSELARGRWQLYPGSDWALEPGALGHLKSIAAELPDDVGVLGAYCHVQGGGLIPYPAPPTGPFGFVEYLRWLNPPVQSDYLYAIRSEVIRQIPWPNDRRLESQFHLRIAKAWRMCFTSRPCATVYFDAPNRLSSTSSEIFAQQTRIGAEDRLTASKEILEEFGPDMRRHAPLWYREVLRGAGALAFILGRRLEGTRLLLRCLCRCPWSLRAWGVLTLGLIGPDALLWGRWRWGR